MCAVALGYILIRRLTALAGMIAMVVSTVALAMISGWAEVVATRFGTGR